VVDHVSKQHWLVYLVCSQAWRLDRKDIATWFWFNPSKIYISVSEFNDRAAVLVVTPSPMGQQPLIGPRPPYFWGFTMTFRHITLRRTPLDEWSARGWDIYLATYNTQQISVTSVGFEPTFPGSERPQTDASDRTATQIGAGEDFTFSIPSCFRFKRNKMPSSQLVKFLVALYGYKTLSVTWREDQ